MNREVGQKGEAIAARYYRQRGYLLLGHNYRTRMGELDLILYKEDLIVFAEVKTRTGRMLGCACGGGGSVQARRLRRAAELYLQNSPFAEARVRFDGWK